MWRSWPFLCCLDGCAGHFIGDCDSCRPSGQPQEVGYIGDGHTLTASGGTAAGSFTETEAKLNGINSIIGRSIIIHHAVGGARIGQCVIGIGETAEPDVQSATLRRAANEMPRPVTSKASCLLQPTTDGDADATGMFMFHQHEDHVEVKYSVFKPSGAVSKEHGFHVHQAGIIGSDGKTTLGHFLGVCDDCRPGDLQEAGLLNDGAKLSVDAQGRGTGSFDDVNIVLNGANSIIGRSIVIHDADDASIRVMECVIGLDAESSNDEPVPEVTSATCYFDETSLATEPVEGTVAFTQTSEGVVKVEYTITGLDAGNHGFHVHQLGNILSDDGSSVEGHFVGHCHGTCRPSGVLQEVGLLDDGRLITSSGSIAAGTFDDTVIELNGKNSIIGRSLVIHGIRDNASPRAAQCVIGRAETDEPKTDELIYVEAPPVVEAAVCLVRPTTNADNADLSGAIVFEAAGAGVEVSYHVVGLAASTTHGFHVHQKGDISPVNGAADGSATAGHFIGTCDNCRPSGLHEAGNLNDGSGLTTDADGVAQGRFTDSEIALNGVDSIIGRSIVIHAASGARIAHCVIGISNEATIANVATSMPSTTDAIDTRSGDNTAEEDTQGWKTMWYVFMIAGFLIGGALGAGVTVSMMKRKMDNQNPRQQL